jgi:hypothetical protein
MKLQRVAPLSGVLAVVLIVVGFGPVGGSTPGSNKSGAEVASFYSNHHSKQFAAAVVVAFGALFLAIFVASLWETLRAAGGGELWATLALIGGTVAVGGFFVAVAVHWALADGGDHHFSAQSMRAINGIDANDFPAFALALGVMVLGAAGATLASGALPRWLGWAALVIGIISFTPAGFLGFALIGIWIIVASIVIWRSGRVVVRPAAA